MNSSATQETSGRAGKLAGFFRNILKGNRKIQSASDAKLFFEAAQAVSTPSSCLESLVASKHGLEALQLSVRVDLSPAFVNSQALPFIGYLIDDQLKLLADGYILQKALIGIVEPPTLWIALVSMAQTGDLEDDKLRIFSWLCLELLSLPKSSDLDVHADIEAVAQGGKFINAPCPETRQLGYKIQKQIQILKSPFVRPGNSYAPGGRHDNDFEDFRRILVYPTTDEFICTDRPFYRRAKEVFETDLSERTAVHLDNTYRLLREDILSELRNDWQNAQVRNRGKRSALTLRQLQLIGLHLGDERYRKKCSLAISCGTGLARLEKINPAVRRQWLNDNKNFLRHQAFGALYQGQEIFGFAFVERDLDSLLSSPPVVILQFTDDSAFKKALVAFQTADDISFTLVDAPVFAYEPVLKRLKDMKELPLQDKLLHPAGAADDFVPVPHIQVLAHGLAREERSLGIKIRGNATNKEFELDYSQQQSLKSALASKVSVIQGPPGTGKSFLGALATHFIMKYTEAKILVITYTNHALDQFLEDLMDLGIDGDKMVRLGSKSTTRTSPLLLFNRKSTYRRSPESWAMIDSLKEVAESES